ncbi:MAG: B12-binding domain-containing radical SAM protein [Bacteroidota bacterium]
MKVLLTHGYFLEEDAREQQIMRPYPPLGILYISAYLEQHGIANEVFDTTFSSKKIFHDYILHHRPPVIGIYTNLMTKLNVLDNIRFIKEHAADTAIILGGPDVRYNAERYLSYGADYIVMGEGEQTMLELTQTLLSGSHRTRSTIAGIAYLEQGSLVQTPEREKIKELDELPVPNRKKIDLHLYLGAWKNFHGTNAVSVSTMRGCPYTCKWCSRAVYGLSYRRRSPEKVVEELMLIQQQYQPDSLWFVDDVFTISHKWLEKFRNELNKQNLKIRYECITRADRMNEEVIGILKDTGCFRVWIGAESGSQKVIDLMDRRVDVEQVRDMIRLSKQHGIQAGTFIMLGYPGETEKDIEETIQHLKESNPDHFTITVAYPIKGTELFEEVEAQTTQLDWNASTDRQIDFKRTYNRKYYDYAVSHVINEVNYFKSGHRLTNLHAAKLKLKSLGAKTGMQWQRFRSLFLVSRS